MSSSNASSTPPSACPQLPSRQLLKQDSFGAIFRISDADTTRICRDTRLAWRGLGWFARWVAAREARALRLLADVPRVPRLLEHADGCVVRSHIDGEPMQVGQPRDPAYFNEARRLLIAIHRRGIAHNDLAKEANWLLTDDGLPAVVDFQMACFAKPRAPLLRLLAREDLRHLLKHKRTYCREHLTPVEKRLLRRRSWIQRLWFASGKRVYRVLTRRVLRWRDDEGGNYAPANKPVARSADNEAVQREH